MRVSKMTSQRTRSWSVARRQLAKGDSGVCKIYIYIYIYILYIIYIYIVLRCCTKAAFTKVDFEACEIQVPTFETSWY